MVVAVPNGSGKTSIMEKILAPAWFSGCAYVNPDPIARDEFAGWNEPESVMKAATTYRLPKSFTGIRNSFPIARQPHG